VLAARNQHIRIPYLLTRTWGMERAENIAQRQPEEAAEEVEAAEVAEVDAAVAEEEEEEAVAAVYLMLD
jgi:hypothetical protein